MLLIVEHEVVVILTKDFGVTESLEIISMALAKFSCKSKTEGSCKWTYRLTVAFARTLVKFFPPCCDA